MICAACKEQGLKSTIRSHGAVTTAMAYDSYYDEDGVYHLHDRNTTTQTWRCSQGHTIVVTTTRGCPNSLICGYSGSREEHVA